MIYTIPTYKVAKLVKKLEAFNRKATKFKAQPIVFTVGSTYSKDYQTDECRLKGINHIVEVNDITIDIESFTPVPGYLFLASIENTPNGNIMHTIDFRMEIPAKFRTSNNHCDHCNTDRYRKTTYIIYNEKKKSFIQVGSTCIKDYLGINVALIASRFEFLTEMEGSMKSCGSEYIIPTYELRIFLATAINCIELDGYVSGKMVYEGTTTKSATGSDTCFVLGPYMPKDIKLQQYKKDRRNFTIANMNEAQVIMAWVKEQPATTDYYQNLQIICKNNYITGKSANMAASMICVYRIALNKLKLKKEFKPSNYIGQIGEKVTLTAEFYSEYSSTGPYGICYIYNFVTKEGNRIVWMSSKPSNFEKEGLYTFSATIKRHQEYKDIKSTMVKSLKLLKK